ncbi:PAS domain S-box-containing protein [Panacagrimonas perspica]|uniref:Sensory/regulatory protein RpfC n=1 Tax=Panacagrimonas perspica TaxID=381431 RepID=A0A4V6Q4C8_9GAMM|nr:PAS domain-containing protein [Panacagrimonas perspica]TDU31096.1 PAS domain S-box-containing protein [Panacagrimonas perspica]
MNDAPKPAVPRDLSRLRDGHFDGAAQERLMTDLAESLPGAVFQLESDDKNNLRYNFVSGRAREVLGVEPQAILDDPLLPSKLVIAKDSSVLFNAYRDSARGIRPVSADVRILRPDGQQRWIRTFATCRKAGGNVMWNGYWNDVTDEVEAREKLERSEARLRAIVDTVPGVLFQLRRDADGSIGINYLSHGSEEMSGIPHEELRRDFGAFLRAVHEEDRPQIAEALERSVSEMKVKEHTVRVNHRDGSLHWITNIVSPRRNEDGQVLWDGITVDITAHKRTEEALVHAETRMREIVGSAPGAVYQVVIGADGVLRLPYVSEGLIDLVGIAKADAEADVGCLFAQVQTLDLPRLQRAIVATAQQRETLSFDFQFRHALSGELRWLRSRATAVRGAGGEVVCNGFWQDITDFKTLEAELRDARDAAQVAERRVRDITDSLPGVVFQMVYPVDGPARVAHVSEGMRELTGIDRDAAMTNLSVLIQNVVPEDRAHVIAETARMARDAGTLRIEFRLRHTLTGEIRWLLARSAGRRMEDGSVVSNGFWQDITEIKTLEAELRDARDVSQASAVQLRVVTDSLPGMVYQYNVAPNLVGTYTMVSDQGPEMFGRTREWITGTPNSLLYLVLKEDQPKLIGAFLEAVRSRGNVDFTYRSQLAGDRIGWLRTRARPIPQADGGVAWSGFTMEVTAEIEARQQLEVVEKRLLEEAKAGERRVREITESLPGVVYRMENVGRNTTRFTDMTDAAHKLYGYTREQIMANPALMSDGVHPDDRVAMRDELMSSARAGRQAQMNFRFNRPDGTFRWLRTYAAAQLIDNGVAWVGYTADVTAEREARDRADEAMRQLTVARDAAESAQQRMRAIFDHTKIGLVMIDANKNFSDANPSLRELLEIADEEQFAREFPKFSPPTQPDGRDSMEKAAEVIGVAFERGYNRFDWMHQTYSGEPRPCEIALTRVELGGKPTIFATMTDMRERLRYETQLMRASEEARSASQAKSEFLANMSHEIRTPMNAIVGLTHLGLSSTDPTRLRDYLGKIDTAAKSLLQIINDILDFSKIEAGKLSLESTPFDLYSVLDNLSGMLNLRAAEKGIELLFAVEPGISAQLMGDPLRLGQILLNLTGNAVKFTDKGQIVVRVKTTKKGKDFVRLRFEVTDTGIGLSAEQISRLFESFSQADTSTTRRYGGTGLGLAISQRLVDLMDGEIAVDSVQGKGSTFHFTARFGLAPETAKRTPTPKSMRGMRVLVVDDNSTAQSILQAYLESFGFVVETVSDGQRAVEAIRNAGPQAFRLVLMDWQMPGMNGIEAARRIRELSSPEPSVIIMVTAFGREEVEHQALSAGLDGFLIKPVNPSVLLDTILDAFGREAALEAGPVSSAIAPTVSLEGLHVLLVEDNEINQEVAMELLKRAGITVDLAKNGREAVDLASAKDYDAVLMDVQMPIMDGLEATRRIRRLESLRATVPIIAMTANAMAEDRQRCIEAGMNDHVGKPVDVSRLHKVLAQWTRGAARSPDVELREAKERELLPRQEAFPDFVRVTVPPTLPGGQAGPDARSAPEEPDFDFPLAVRQMGDSVALWEKLARRYGASASPAAQIMQSLAASDRESARRNAHTLKGVAATLGLLALKRAAAEVERALAAGSGVAMPDLEELTRADETARRVIGQHLSK